MDDEDLLKRPPPLQPYAPVEAVIVAPVRAVATTLALLQRPGRLESGVLWYGERAAGGDGAVQLVVAPRQRMYRGHYEIHAEAVAEIVRCLPESWRPLAQVHSHPGPWVEHSSYDDRMALSRRALSLIFPYYGNYAPHAFPTGVGVHEHQDGYWHLLPPDVACRRISLVEGDVEVVDLR